MQPRLYRVILPVREIEEGARFYSATFGMPGVRVSPGRHYFNLGGTILALYDPSADGDEKGDWKHHPNQFIYIGVEDLAAARERAVQAGAKEVTAIERMPWGESLLYMKDPSGNPVSLVDGATLFLGDG